MKYNQSNLRKVLRHSNAIEGVYDKRSLADAKKAWDFLIKFETMNSQILKHAHKLLMRNQKIEYKYKGEYRDVPVYIGGEKKDQTKEQIISLMRKWCIKTNKVDRSFDPVTLHIEFEDIHPFIDGNGRIGRLLLNWHSVIRNEGPMIFYDSNDKPTYYRLFQGYRNKERASMFDIVSMMQELKTFKEFDE